MARHGIEGAGLREINALAGQRNLSAVHYHFGDRAGLINALRDKHRPSIDREIADRLTTLEATGDVAVPSLIRSFTEPNARSLESESGRDFLIILAEATNRTSSGALIPSDLPYTEGFNRLTALLLERVEGNELRRRSLVGQAVLAGPTFLADIARDLKAERITQKQAGDRVEAVIDFIVRGIEA
jgi:AcrR family transcriptional regulator